MAAALYLRISSDPSGLRAGVERQERDCRELAERRGWPVAGVYCDNDVSADSSKPRPAYRQLLADIEAGQVDAVVVWALDRLHRRPAELERFFEVCDRAGVTRLASVAGDVDLGTDDGRFHARILGAVAKKENDDRRRRIQRKALELAEQGRVAGGGTRPFGYEDDRVTVVAVEADLIREAAGWVLAGESIRSIVDRWNKAKIPTPAGNAWRSASLRRLLLSARIAGLREHHGQVTAEAVWPAIIDRPTHERLRAVLTDPARQKYNGVEARRYLLTGFLFCGLCGKSLVARPRMDGRRTYVCASGPNFGGCGKIRRLAEPVEELVRDAVFTALDGPGLAAALQAATGEDQAERELLASLRADQERLDELVDAFADGTLSRADLARARSRIETRTETTRRRLARRTASRTLMSLPSGRDALRRQWDAHDDAPTGSGSRAKHPGLAWQRSLLAAVIDRVVLHPCRRGVNRFDPTRVEIIWRV
jgi:DNA invertase Pin-like site-specific DNA recombinase